MQFLVNHHAEIYTSAQSIRTNNQPNILKFSELVAFSYIIGTMLWDTTILQLPSIVGLSFLFIEMKELCEARAKLETSSNFQIYPGKTDNEPPPLETARALSELFAVQYCQRDSYPCR